jgi:hypothetical protein
MAKIKRTYGSIIQNIKAKLNYILKFKWVQTDSRCTNKFARIMNNNWYDKKSDLYNERSSIFSLKVIVNILSWASVVKLVSMPWLRHNVCQLTNHYILHETLKLRAEGTKPFMVFSPSTCKWHWIGLYKREDHNRNDWHIWVTAHLHKNKNRISLVHNIRNKIIEHKG